MLLGIVLALASLWLGVGQLSILQVGRVLIGHSTDGSRWECGPLFWAMHTVFLPLLFYLSLVLLCYLAKIFIVRRVRFYKRARLNGLNMTARFLAYVAVALGLTAALLAVVPLIWEAKCLKRERQRGRLTSASARPRRPSLAVTFAGRDSSPRGFAPVTISRNRASPLIKRKSEKREPRQSQRA